MATKTTTTTTKKKAPPKPATPKKTPAKKTTPTTTKKKTTATTVKGKPKPTDTLTIQPSPPAGSADLSALQAQFGGSANPYAGLTQTNTSMADELQGVRVVTDYANSRLAMVGPDSEVFKPLTEQDGSQMFKDFLSSGDVNYVRRMQEQLYAAGFYSVAKKNIRFGDRTDAATQKALHDAIIQARDLQQAGNRMTFNEMLTEAARYASAEDEGPERAPLVLKVSDPLEMRKIIDGLTPTIVGHGLGEDEIQRLITTYQSLEVGSQRAVYDMAGASGGTAPSVPDFDTYVASEVEKTHPQDAHDKKLANVAKLFTAVISDQAPQTAVF